MTVEPLDNSFKEVCKTRSVCRSSPVVGSSKKTSIILFDEPTTGLDLHTERVLQTSLKELSKGSTVITVAHRLHTIANADKIYFLDSGKLHAVGTHEELIESVTSYREMVHVQQGGIAE